MARPRVWIGVVVVAGLIGAGSLRAQKPGTVTLSAQDVTEIEQLYASMYQGSDLRDHDLWLSTFAPDAVFTLPNGSKLAGKKALSEWRMKSWGGKTGDTKQRHWFGLIRAVPAPDGAAAVKAYFSVLDVGAKQPAIRSSGIVDDVFVKTPDGWRFKIHTVILDVPNE